MDIVLRKYTKADLHAAQMLWNGIVDEGNSFPQDEPLSEQEAKDFFEAQLYVGIAEDAGEVVGMYILHPNNVGRCGHIANASYAVKSTRRGKRIGERLVRDSIRVAEQLSFRILQFNAVVASNASAIHLYQKLGFQALGTIPGGFRMKDGRYEDIIPFYIELRLNE